MVVWRVKVRPRLGTMVTAIVQRPFCTARILLPLNVQNRVPARMLIRNLPCDVLGMVIETAPAILEALTLRPRRSRNGVITGCVLASFVS